MTHVAESRVSYLEFLVRHCLVGSRAEHGGGLVVEHHTPAGLFKDFLAQLDATRVIHLLLGHAHQLAWLQIAQQQLLAEVEVLLEREKHFPEFRAVHLCDG